MFIREVNHRCIGASSADVNPKGLRSVRSLDDDRSMEAAKNAVGRRIKQRLRQLDKTQAWLAEQCDIKPTAVGKWIHADEASGEAPKIARESLLKASKALKCTMEWLWAGTGISPEAYELALDWETLDERRRYAWKHTIKAEADVAREERRARASHR